jgi:hypothetical protein
MKFDPKVIPDGSVIKRKAFTAAFEKGTGGDGGVKMLKTPYPYEIAIGMADRIFATTLQINADQTRTFIFDYFVSHHLDPNNKRANRPMKILWEASDNHKISIPAGPDILSRIDNQITIEQNRQAKQMRKM